MKRRNPFLLFHFALALLVFGANLTDALADTLEACGAPCRDDAQEPEGSEAQCFHLPDATTPRFSATDGIFRIALGQPIGSALVPDRGLSFEARDKRILEAIAPRPTLYLTHLALLI